MNTLARFHAVASEGAARGTPIAVAYLELLDVWPEADRANLHLTVASCVGFGKLVAELRAAGAEEVPIVDDAGGLHRLRAGHRASWRYAYAEGRRDDSGLDADPIGRFRIALAYWPSEIRANLPPSRAIRVGGALWRSFDLADGDTLADALEGTVFHDMSAFLRVMLPCWRTLDGRRAQEQSSAEAALGEPDERLDALATLHGVDIAEVVQALAHVQLLACTTTLDEETYTDATLPWAIAGIRGEVQEREHWTNREEGWCMLAATSEGEERLLLVLDSAHDHAEELASIPGGEWSFAPQGDQIRGRVYSVKQVPRLAAALDTRAPDVAGALRAAFLVDPSLVFDPLMLALSRATRVEDLPTPDMRRVAQRVVAAIPLPDGKQLYPYQAAGVVYAKATGYRALIGDEMGLGKTIQAIAALSLGREHLLPALVVCPSSVMSHWVEQLAQFAPWFDVQTLDKAAQPLRQLGKRSVVVVSWGMLDRASRTLGRASFQCVVYDEVQYAKNLQSARTGVALQLAGAAPHVLALTGTPLLNSVSEVYPPLRMLDPAGYPSLDSFTQEYGDGRRLNAKGRWYVLPQLTRGVSYSPLAVRLRRHMVRRLKAEVLPDLPAKQRTYLWCDLPPAAAQTYKQVETSLYQWLLGQWQREVLAWAVAQFNARAESTPTVPQHRQQLIHQIVKEANDKAPSRRLAELALTRVNHLRRVAGRAKAGAVAQWLADWFSANGGPVVIFAEHRAVVRAVEDALRRQAKRYTTIDGSIRDPLERGRRVAAFEGGEVDAIVLSQAGHTGITLVRASTVLFAERWWVPSMEEQAEDRLHRIGQQSQVSAVYLMARRTLDEHVHRVVDRKRQLVQAVIDTSDVEQHSARGELSGIDAMPLTTAFVTEVLAQLRQANPGKAKITADDLRAALSTSTG